MCDIENMWKEASKIAVSGTEELLLDNDDLMSIFDNIPLEGDHDIEDGAFLEDNQQWFVTGSSSPHCFGPIPSNLLFFEPTPDRKNGTNPPFSSPVTEDRLTIDGTPEEKTHTRTLETNNTTRNNNPRNNVATPKSNSKDSSSAINVRARSKRAKPSGPTKWHFFSGVDSTYGKDITKRASSSSSSSVITNTKTCTHCKITKTPQWREGPNGPKTLCNACGVRYRMGRLFPEYRPAASPTFRPSLHSNSHKKVVEMRKDKAKTPSGW